MVIFNQYHNVLCAGFGVSPSLEAFLLFLNIEHTDTASVLGGGVLVGERVRR